MTEKNYHRPLSPYTFIEEFNKRVINEEKYPKSENPNLFVWNLEFQKLNPVKVPPQMVDKHLQKVRYEHQQQLGRKNNENIVEGQNPLENKTIKGISILPQLTKENDFKLLKSPTNKERRHNFSVTNFLSQQLKGNADKKSPMDLANNCFDRKNMTFTKILSNIPVSVLEKFQEEKDRNMENLMSTRSQQQSRRHITPIVNQSVTKDLYSYMAFDPLQPKKQEERIKTFFPKEKVDVTQLNSLNSRSNLRSPNRETSEHGKNSNRDEKQESNLSQTAPNFLPKEQFRFKNSKELVQFNEKAENKTKQFRAEKQSPINKPVTLPHKLEQKLSVKNPHQMNPKIDDKKNFFNYRKYCYLNYKDAKSGLKMDLSKDCVRTLEKFEQTIFNYMGDQNFSQI